MSRQRPHRNRLIRILTVMLYRKRYTLVISFLVVIAMVGCLIYSWDKGLKPYAKPEPRTWAAIEESGTLRAVTIVSSFTAFKYNDIWYGHEYDNAKQIAEALGLNLEIITAPNEAALVDSLFTGAADVSIWPMSYSVGKGHWFLRPTGVRWMDYQRLVSSVKIDTAAYRDSTLTDSAIMTLPKYKLSIIDGSRQWLVYHDDSIHEKYDFRPFVLDSLPYDSLNSELLTDSMIFHATDAVMLRCNVARLMHDYYPMIQLLDTITDSQDSLAWMLTIKSDTLSHLIDSISANLEQGTPQYTIAQKRFGEQKRNKARKASRFTMKEGALSPYDGIFRSKGLEHEIDWRLLASIAFIESNFKHEIVSTKGPLGLMQLMPQTVSSHGYTNEEAMEPEVNVELACRLLDGIFRMVRRRCSNISDDDLICFSLVGYNAGIGHLFDAINLADTLGYRTNVWEGNVEHCLRLKSDPHYYRLSVVKCGKFNGAFTINYVNEVIAAYHTFCEKMPEEEKKEGKQPKSSKKK